MSKQIIEGPTRECGEGADGHFYGVTQLRGGGDRHRRKPCEQCPWRADLPTGVFPPQAFRESAPTAYDMAMSTFSCHMSGKERPATCAGFLFRHSVNNMQVRQRLLHSAGWPEHVSDGGFPIYKTYREMAIANGVDPDDPVLKPIRGDDE